MEQILSHGRCVAQHSVNLHGGNLSVGHNQMPNPLPIGSCTRIAARLLRSRERVRSGWTREDPDQLRGHRRRVSALPNPLRREVSDSLLDHQGRFSKNLGQVRANESPEIIQ
jgi:hypothetical protein